MNQEHNAEIDAPNTMEPWLAQALSEWRTDAERDAEATVAPSGYYPSARILRLIEEVERHRATTVTPPEGNPS